MASKNLNYTIPTSRRPRSHKMGIIITHSRHMHTRTNRVRTCWGQRYYLYYSTTTSGIISIIDPLAVIESVFSADCASCWSISKRRVFTFHMLCESLGKELFWMEVLYEITQLYSYRGLCTGDVYSHVTTSDVKNHITVLKQGPRAERPVLSIITQINGSGPPK